jgi:hypothetical protein
MAKHDYTSLLTFTLSPVVSNPSGIFFRGGEIIPQVMLYNGQRVNNPAQLQNLPPARVKRMIAADDLAARLAELRAQWESATGGKLDAVTINLRMLFDDLQELISSEVE